MTTALNRDANRVVVAGGVYDDGSGTIAAVPINASNGRVKISATVAAGALGTWYDVTGTIDGSNTTFTIPVTPSKSILLFLGRQPQMPTVDFTLSGSTITYVTAPDSSLSGQPHKAFLCS